MWIENYFPICYDIVRAGALKACENISTLWEDYTSRLFFLLKSKSILAENLEPFILHEQTFQFRVTTGQVVGQTQSCAQEKHLTWLKKQRVARTSPQIGVQGHRWVICFSRTASGWQQQFDYKVKRSDKIGIVYKKLRKTVLGLSSSGEIWSEQLSSTLVSLLL